MQPLSLDRYAAIIWDCDGVLIDSEMLSCSLAVEILAEKGVHITLEEYTHRFLGNSLAQMMAALGVADSFPVEEMHRREKEASALHLKAIPGVHDVLKSLSLPVAVASSGRKARIDHALGITKLLPYFNGHIYSAEMVRNGKPAPDLFLLAAEKLGVAPADCLVIEDSTNGVRGARSAGMDVYAFTGGGHMTPALRQKLADAKPTALFDHMQALLSRHKAAKGY
jgi:HAD superfamily hydrolase (TIGR01509 family)